MYTILNVKKILQKDNNMTNDKTGKNFIGVSATILASKALGFIRDILVAASIGTSKLSDVYTQVFGVASLLFTSIGMALSSVNIPNLTYYLTNANEEERKKYISGLFAQLFMVGSIVSILGIFLAPLVTGIILPGLDSDVTDIAVTLTRIMFPTLLFICLAYVSAGILQVHRRFLISSLISIPFNLVIIASLLIWKNNILALGYVTTLGWLLQFLIQLPVLIREKYTFSFKLDFKNEHIKDVYTKLFPILLGNAALQLCLITDRAFASHLEEGSAAALSFGSMLFTTITSIFIVAMSTVTFPDLSKFCLEKDYLKVKRTLNYIFKVLFFILVPYLIIVTVYNRDIIQLVYERGTFNEKSTSMTSMAFLFYSYCIAGYVCQEIFNRVYYSLKKFNVPMVLSGICIILNYLMVTFSYKLYGISGIAGSTAVSFTIYAIIMSISVTREVGAFLGRDFGRYLQKLAMASTGMLVIDGAIGFLGLQGVIGAFILPVVLSSVVYLAVAYFTGIIKELLFRRMDDEIEL